MTQNRVTVAFVPREVFSTTKRSLETLLENTAEPFDLVCVDGNSPPDVAAYLERTARERGFTLLRSERYLTPNQSRNLAAQHVRTPYVVFVDNDIDVSPGWLTPLVDCAEETGAMVVGPLQLESLGKGPAVHIYGGECRLEPLPDGKHVFCEHQGLHHTPLDEVEEPLVRKEVELVELHTTLIAMRAFDVLGPLDERLMSFFEYCDLCMLARQHGEKVYVEPQSRVTYVPPPRMSDTDREFYKLRWSEAWNLATIERFIEKWNLHSDDAFMQRAERWGRHHRAIDSRVRRALRRWIGPKWGNSLEKRLVARFEAAANLRHYPPKQHGRPTQPEVTTVHAPRDSVAA